MIVKPKLPNVRMYNVHECNFSYISSPGEMADSMTQSMASVSSLARDFSWEQLHTDTEREVITVMVVIVLAMMMITGVKC